MKALSSGKNGRKTEKTEKKEAQKQIKHSQLAGRSAPKGDNPRAAAECEAILNTSSIFGYQKV